MSVRSRWRRFLTLADGVRRDEFHGNVRSEHCLPASQQTHRAAEVAQAVVFIGILEHEVEVISAAIAAIDTFSVPGRRGRAAADLRLVSQASDLFDLYRELNRQIDALSARFPEVARWISGGASLRAESAWD